MVVEASICNQSKHLNMVPRVCIKCLDFRGYIVISYSGTKLLPGTSAVSQTLAPKTATVILQVKNKDDAQRI